VRKRLTVLQKSSIRKKAMSGASSGGGTSRNTSGILFGSSTLGVDSLGAEEGSGVGIHARNRDIIQLLNGRNAGRCGSTIDAGLSKKKSSEDE